MSSSDYAIRIKGIGKQYRLGIGQSGGMYKYKSLRDSLGNMVRSPLKAVRSLLPEPLDESNSFWALKDVSFDVKRGEVVGIIGRNGAGKSTLLKILSRITRPTTGEIELHGRVGSLLEVGTGFHPELSGRENIYLNGAVLGMTRAEVKKKFDEIVAFSEIEKFLDTPVKQYSSGMYMRLAFAVAAHLEPELLVVDEVLAVGDAEFQSKCIGKMKHVASEGRTVLFVSHNLGSISSLCSRCIWLSLGELRCKGPSDDIIRQYLSRAGATNAAEFEHGPLKWCEVVAKDDGIHVVAEFSSEVPIDLPSLGFVVSNAHGQAVLGDNPRLSQLPRLLNPTKRGWIRAHVRTPKLRDGDYAVSLWFGDSASDFVHHVDALRFTVAASNTGSANHLALGSAVPDTSWTFLNEGDELERKLRQ